MAKLQFILRGSADVSKHYLQTFVSRQRSGNQHQHKICPVRLFGRAFYGLLHFQMAVEDEKVQYVSQKHICYVYLLIADHIICLVELAEMFHLTPFLNENVLIWKRIVSFLKFMFKFKFIF